MIKTLIYFPPEYKNLALKIRENYIEHHHGEVDLVSETDQNDIEYARKEKYDEAIFIENIDSVVIHDIKSGYTNRCSISDVCYFGNPKQAITLLGKKVVEQCGIEKYI